MKKIKTFLIICFLFSIVGCATGQTYTGLIKDCVGEPIPMVEIAAWKNKLVPFHLPENLGSVTTNEVGEFVLKTDKPASFFVYSGSQLIVQSHPNKSNTKCE